MFMGKGIKIPPPSEKCLRQLISFSNPWLSHKYFIPSLQEKIKIPIRILWGTGLTREEAISNILIV